MSEMNYPSNAKSNKKQKEVKKVVHTEVKQRKKPIGEQISKAIIADDAKNIGSYIIWDVVVPFVKDALWGIIAGGAEMALFGETRRSRRGSSGPTFGRSANTGSTYIAYNDIVARKQLDSTRKSRSTHEFDDLVFDSKAEAEEVLSDMVDMASEYGFVSVHDFYEMCGLEASPTDEKWGWNNLSKADTRRVTDGYIIALPKTVFYE